MISRYSINFAKFLRFSSQKQTETLKSQVSSSRDIVDNYRQISCLEKTNKIIKQAYLSATDPQNGWHYSKLTDLTGSMAAEKIYRRMKTDPTGARILKEKPRITDQLYEKLGDLPEGTFGKEYFNFMDGLNFKPSGRPVVRFIEDFELAYVIQRYKEIHDFVHTLIGHQISVDEELVIKWFEMRQLELPSATLASLMSPLLSSSFQLAQISKVVRLADKAKFIMNVYYEELFDMPIETVRKDLGYL